MKNSFSIPSTPQLDKLLIIWAWLACQTPCSNLWKLNQWFLLYTCFHVLLLKEGGSKFGITLLTVSKLLESSFRSSRYVSRWLWIHFPGFLNKPVELLLVCRYPFHVLTPTCKLGLFYRVWKLMVRYHFSWKCWWYGAMVWRWLRQRLSKFQVVNCPDHDGHRYLRYDLDNNFFWTFSYNMYY